MHVLDLAYHGCLSSCQEHKLDLASKHMKMMQLAWIFCVLLVFEIYAATLTSILTVSVGTAQTFTSVGDCKARDCVFCTQKGAANDAYFRTQFRGLNIKSEASITDQINQLLSDEQGSCDAIELTREDLLSWGNRANVNRCGVETTPSPIMER